MDAATLIIIGSNGMLGTAFIPGVTDANPILGEHIFLTALPEDTYTDKEIEEIEDDFSVPIRVIKKDTYMYMAGTPYIATRLKTL